MNQTSKRLELFSFIDIALLLERSFTKGLSLVRGHSGKEWVEEDYAPPCRLTDTLNYFFFAFLFSSANFLRAACSFFLSLALVALMISFLSFILRAKKA